MQVKLIESLSEEDDLKLKNFLTSFFSSLQALFKSQSQLFALKTFVHVPIVLPYEKPVFILNSSWAQDLVFYQNGYAYVRLEEKRGFFLSFDWDHLYEYAKDLENQKFFWQEMGALKRLDLGKTDKKQKSLKVLPVYSGHDLLKRILQATWFFVQQQKEPILREPRFVALLPLALYPYLKEPASHASYRSIQEELLERLATKVWLSPTLQRQAILLWEDSLLPSLTVQPCYFLGVDEEGKRKIWFSFKESGPCEEVPHVRLQFKRSWFRRPAF